MLASAGVLTMIIMWVDPTSGAAGLPFVLLFLALFLFISSFASLAGYLFRTLFLRSQLSAYRVRPSLRQGIFLGVFCDLLIFLQLQRILVWWVSGIIILLGIVIELVFLSYDKHGTRNRETGHAGA
jgi:hypothetical protein